MDYDPSPIDLISKEYSEKIILLALNSDIFIEEQFL